MEPGVSSIEAKPWRGFDYRSQLLAIRALLERQRLADAELNKEMEIVAESARKSIGDASAFFADRWTDLAIDGFFQFAAHSMSAVGMLAPMTESVFREAFRKIGIAIPLPEGETGGLVADIIKSAKEVGMGAYLPADLRPTLEALFEYRNKMFHFGLEWPLEETEKFNNRIKCWPENWFVLGSQGNSPWMFCMSQLFVDHCLNSVEHIISGLGDFLVDELRERSGQPRLGLQEGVPFVDFLGIIGDDLLEPQ